MHVVAASMTVPSQSVYPTALIGYSRVGGRELNFDLLFVLLFCLRLSVGAEWFVAENEKSGKLIASSLFCFVLQICLSPLVLFSNLGVCMVTPFFGPHVCHVCFPCFPLLVFVW